MALGSEDDAGGDAFDREDALAWALTDLMLGVRRRRRAWECCDATCARQLVHAAFAGTRLTCLADSLLGPFVKRAK